MSAIERVDMGEILTAYEKCGDGPPLILVHGAEGDRRQYQGLMPLLAPYFTVISYDQRDTGDTLNPATPYTMSDLGRDLGDFIGALGYDKAHVFGTSYGGVIAQNAALERPDRIDRLVLSATTASEPGTASMGPAAAELAKSSDPAAREQLMKLYVAKKNREPDRWPAVLAAMQARRTTRPVEGHARRMQAVMSNATSARLGEILCPTLIIVGAEDEIVPPDRSRFLAEHIPQAKLHILPDAGHGWTMEFPELAVELLRDFLLA